VQITISTGDHPGGVVVVGTSEYRHRHVWIGGNVFALPTTRGWVEMSATREIDLVVCLRIPPNSELTVRLYL
jgi:hypothetical protein